MPKIAIIIPCINLWKKYTKNCIESIKTKYEYRLLLVDNFSQDETKVEAGKLVSNVFSHRRNEEVWSCAKSWNYGIRDAFERGYDYVLVLNNDVLIHPDSIDILVDRFEKEKKSSGSKKLAMATMHDVRGECESPEDIFKLSISTKANVPESEHPCFSGFMINKDCWDTVGEFDENFRPAYFEDNDYHYRINLKKMKAIVVPTSLFYHFGNGTQNEANPGQRITSNQQFEMNRRYYHSKWGGIPGEEKFIKPFDEK